MRRQQDEPLERGSGRRRRAGGGEAAFALPLALAFLLGALAPSPAAGQDPWWDAGWQNRKQVTFDNSASAENLTDFPVLVKLTGAEIDYSKTQDQGQDIRFVDAGGSPVQLDHEIEDWDEAGTSEVWVKVPQVDAGSTSDYIWMYYNNPSATDGQNASGVWSNDYRGVWHLNEAGGTRSDATANGNDVNEVNTVGSATGRIDVAGQFVHPNEEKLIIDDGAQTGLDLSTAGTWMAWVRPDTSNVTQSAIDKENAADAGYRLRLNGGGDGHYNCTVWDASGVEQGGRGDTKLTEGVWAHLTCIYDGSAIKTYHNGVFERSYAYSGGIQDSPSAFQLGARANGQHMHGLLDEARVMAAARSDDWIEAQYLTQSGGFISSFGAEESGSGIPTLSSAADQTFVVGDLPTATATITIADDASTPTITAANDLRVRIPAGFNMIWDTTVTTVTLGGGAASKVSGTLLPYEDAAMTVVLDVTGDFAAGDTLSVDGLRFAEFSAVSEPDNLELEVADDGAVSATDDATIRIVAETVGVIVTPDGLGSPVVRTQGTAYNQDFLVKNTGNGDHDFDLIARTEPASSYLGIDSITGSNVSQGARADSALVSGLGAGDSVTVLLWYTVDIATDGRVDTLYMHGRARSTDVSDEGWAEVEYDAPDAALLGRYWLNEAPSGQVPDTVYDDQSSPLHLPISFTPELAWAVRDEHRGLRSFDVGHAGIATVPVGGTKYVTTLDNANQASFVVVASYVDSIASGLQALAGFLGGTMTEAPALIAVNDAGAILLGVRTKSQTRTGVRWSSGYADGVRRAFHFVYDAQHDTAERRIRLYVDGVDQGPGTLLGEGSWPAQGEALDFNVSGLELRMMNRWDGAMPTEGTLHYYAVYDGMLEDAEISSDASSLLADDDNITLDVSVTLDGLDTIPRLPSNGISYSYRFNIANNSTVYEDFDLFAFPGDLMSTIFTVDSITGPSVTRDEAIADSARISSIAAGASDSAFAWYSVGDVAAGTLDSLYLEGRSFTDGASADSGWTFVEVVRPNLTTSRSVSPSGTQLPGTDLTYTVTVTNDGSHDATAVVIVDSLATETQFKLNSVVNSFPDGITASVEYSDDGGTSWTYTPADGGCGAPSGYDACVTHIRWTLDNPLPSSPPDNAADVQFVARIE